MTALTAKQGGLVAATWSPPAGTGATATITDPLGSVLVITASSAAAQPNVWTVWFTALSIGTYSIVWQALGAVATETDTLVVSGTATQTILTIQQCYLSLNMPVAGIGSSDVVKARDADMLTYAAAAVRVVEKIIGRQSTYITTEVFDGGGLSVLLTDKPTAILAVVENGVNIADFVPDFRASIIHAGTTWFNRPFWPGTKNVSITYQVGTGAPEPNVLLAMREEFRHLWQLGREGGHTQMAQGVDQTLATPQGFAIPNRVYELLAQEPSMPGFA